MLASSRFVLFVLLFVPYQTTVNWLSYYIYNIIIDIVWLPPQYLMRWDLHYRTGIVKRAGPKLCDTHVGMGSRILRPALLGIPVFKHYYEPGIFRFSLSRTTINCRVSMHYLLHHYEEMLFTWDGRSLGIQMILSKEQYIPDMFQYWCVLQSVSFSCNLLPLSMNLRLDTFAHVSAVIFPVLSTALRPSLKTPFIIIFTTPNKNVLLISFYHVVRQSMYVKLNSNDIKTSKLPNARSFSH